MNDVQFDCLSAAEFKQLLDIVERLIDSSNRALSLQAYFAEKGVTAPDRHSRERFSPKLDLQ